MIESGEDFDARISRCVQEHGYRIELARNAPEALRLLSAGRAVDLVFSDVVMPGGMNGFHLARELRDRRPDLPVLLTTGYSDFADNAGTGDFPLLTKPYTVAALGTAIAAALETARSRRRPGTRQSAALVG